MSRNDHEGFSHLDREGRASMVDVSGKEVTRRTASAGCRILLGREVCDALLAREVPKGDVLATARIAGVQGAKRTAELVPLCHPLPLEHVEVRFEMDEDEAALDVVARVVVTARTGAEMEALAACAAAALTVYDMCKALSKEIRVNDLRLLAKEGGRSGSWRSSG